MGKKIVGILVAVYITTALLRFAPSEAFAFFDRLTVSDTVTVNIGTWQDQETFPPFDSNTQYQVGDIFIFDGRLWRVRGAWFNPNQFVNQDGSLNESYLASFGPIEEFTDEWRSFNTYQVGDVVNHLGFDWIVRHNGASSVEPGSNTNAWNRLSEEWFIYNTYVAGDIVTYQGNQFIALSNNRSRVPGEVTWAWNQIN